MSPAIFHSALFIHRPAAILRKPFKVSIINRCAILSRYAHDHLPENLKVIQHALVGNAGLLHAPVSLDCLDRRLRLFAENAVGFILKETKIDEHLLKLTHILTPAAAGKIRQRAWRGKQQHQQTGRKLYDCILHSHSSAPFLPRTKRYSFPCLILPVFKHSEHYTKVPF